MRWPVRNPGRRRTAFGWIAHPNPTDHSQVARLALLGVVPGDPFDASRFTEAERAEIQAGAEEALAALVAAPNRLAVPVNGWVSYTTGMGVCGNDYLKRAMISLAGLGANPAVDAIYPLLITDADGEPVTGDTNYVIHFDAEQLPPVAAFWSITMYDAEGFQAHFDAEQLPPVAAFWSITMYDAEGFQAANELDRFAIGDRDDLTYNGDGSLDIYIQHDSPGLERVSNWLPAPKGPLGITMRLYAPSQAALDGVWNPPSVQKNARK